MDKMYSPKRFIEITNIGDIVTVQVNRTVSQGVVELVSKRGVNLKQENGTFFYKWQHVIKLSKKQETNYYFPVSHFSYRNNTHKDPF